MRCPTWATACWSTAISSTSGSPTPGSFPARGFQVAAALARLRRRTAVAMVGGNHDRWGGDFWERELGLSVRARISSSSRSARRGSGRVHGDGVADAMAGRPAPPADPAPGHRGGLPAAASRSRRSGWCDWLSPASSATTPGRRPRSAASRGAGARGPRGALTADPSLGLVVMGHTHRAALVEPAPAGSTSTPAPGSTASATPSPPPSVARPSSCCRFSPSAPLRLRQPLPDKPRADLAEPGPVVAHRESMARAAVHRRRRALVPQHAAQRGRGLLRAVDQR